MSEIYNRNTTTQTLRIDLPIGILVLFDKASERATTHGLNTNIAQIIMHALRKFVKRINRECERIDCQAESEAQAQALAVEENITHAHVTSEAVKPAPKCKKLKKIKIPSK